MRLSSLYVMYTCHHARRLYDAYTIEYKIFICYREARDSTREHETLIVF